MKQFVTLSELIDELESLKSKYGDYHVMTIGSASGTYKGKVAPYIIHCISPQGYRNFRHNEDYEDEEVELPVSHYTGESPSTVRGHCVKPASKKSTAPKLNIRNMF